jgi:hypothetical protein
MYCPKCSQQQVDDNVRYCSRCGFELSVVRACLAGAAPASGPEALPVSAPRRRNINLGVASMLSGALFTAWCAAFGHVHPEVAFIILTLCFFAVRLLARPLTHAFDRLTGADESQPGNGAARRQEMNAGTTYMFVGTLLATLCAFIVPDSAATVAFFTVLLSIFTLLMLFSHRLLRATQMLLTDDKEQHAPSIAWPRAGLDASASDRALPPAQGVPVSIFGAQRVTTAEMAAPPSVTERTTSLLQDE